MRWESQEKNRTSNKQRQGEAKVVSGANGVCLQNESFSSGLPAYRRGEIYIKKGAEGRISSVRMVGEGIRDKGGKGQIRSQQSCPAVQGVIVRDQPRIS